MALNGLTGADQRRAGRGGGEDEGGGAWERAGGAGAGQLGQGGAGERGREGRGGTFFEGGGRLQCFLALLPHRNYLAFQGVNNWNRSHKVPGHEKHISIENGVTHNSPGPDVQPPPELKAQKQKK